MSANTQKRINPLQWLVRYLREAHEEMKKVSWPSRKDTVKYSITVIVLCLVLAFFFAGLDWALSFGLQKLIALKK